MPPQNVSKDDCKVCKNGNRWLMSCILAILAALGPACIWLASASLEAADKAHEASCLIGDHMAADTVEKQAITRTLDRMEVRQMEMGKRIDGIFQKLGE